MQERDWKLFCDFWNLDPNDFDLDLEAKRLQEFCAENNILFCDLTPSFRTAAAAKNLFFWEDSHLNEYGNQIASEARADFMKPHW